MCARLCTLFATQGTTVELTWGNSLRNIWYYEDKVRRFVCIRLNLSCVCDLVLTLTQPPRQTDGQAHHPRGRAQPRAV